MTIGRLELTNVRSHRQADFTLGPRTVFLGPNGVGKTNVLEALWVLATTRSFRAHRDSELISWEQPAAHIRAGRLEVSIAREPIAAKFLKTDGVLRRPLEYLGQIRAVLFTPESLRIITGEPSARRRFLDILLAQRSRAGAEDLNRYRQALSQRNALLKQWARGSAGEDSLEPWDEQLATTGARIIAARLQLVGQIQALLPVLYRSISGKPESNCQLTYQTTGDPDPHHFRQKLVAARARERILQTSCIGPHRDDLFFSLHRYPMAENASRGEIRSAIVALKWAECQLVRDAEDVPLLLLDDLFSELDEDRRAALSELMEEAQTVCSTTDAEFLPKALQKSALLIPLAKEPVHV